MKNYNIFLLGIKKTGKTTFLKKLFNETYNNYSSTIGMEIKTIKYDNKDKSNYNNEININYIDTSGVDFNNLINSIININNSAIILFFDIENDYSFKKVIDWLNKNEELLNCKKINNNNYLNFPIFLIGFSKEKKSKKYQKDIIINYKYEKKIIYNCMFLTYLQKKEEFNSNINNFIEYIIKYYDELIKIYAGNCILI